MLSRCWLIVAVLAAWVCAPTYALADGATISAGARLAATCAACHGTNGATRSQNGYGLGSDSGSGQGAALPPLAGQSQQVLLASLRAFKSGSRQATIMTQIAKGYTDEQLELLAGYFAAQKK